MKYTSAAVIFCDLLFSSASYQTRGYYKVYLQTMMICQKFIANMTSL